KPALARIVYVPPIFPAAGVFPPLGDPPLPQPAAVSARAATAAAPATVLVRPPIRRRCPLAPHLSLDVSDFTGIGSIWHLLTVVIHLSATVRKALRDNVMSAFGGAVERGREFSR